MFPKRYFSAHYWAERFFSNGAGVAPLDGSGYFSPRFFPKCFFPGQYFPPTGGAVGPVVYDVDGRLVGHESLSSVYSYTQIVIIGGGVGGPKLPETYTYMVDGRLSEHVTVIHTLSTVRNEPEHILSLHEACHADVARSFTFPYIGELVAVENTTALVTRTRAHTVLGTLNERGGTGSIMGKVHTESTEELALLGLGDDSLLGLM